MHSERTTYHVTHSWRTRNHLLPHWQRTRLSGEPLERRDLLAGIDDLTPGDAKPDGLFNERNVIQILEAESTKVSDSFIILDGLIGEGVAGDGTGEGRFDQKDIVSALTRSHLAGQVHIVDFDDDGILDAVFGDVDSDNFYETIRIDCDDDGTKDVGLVGEDGEYNKKWVDNDGDGHLDDGETSDLSDEESSAAKDVQKLIDDNKYEDAAKKVKKLLCPHEDEDDEDEDERKRDDRLAQVADVNEDGVFTQLDIVQVLQAGKYLTGEPADRSEGDWNDDDVFDQLDLVFALQFAQYGQKVSRYEISTDDSGATKRADDPGTENEDSQESSSDCNVPDQQPDCDCDCGGLPCCDGPEGEPEQSRGTDVVYPWDFVGPLPPGGRRESPPPGTAGTGGATAGPAAEAERPSHINVPTWPQAWRAEWRIGGLSQTPVIVPERFRARFVRVTADNCSATYQNAQTALEKLRGAGSHMQVQDQLAYIQRIKEACKKLGVDLH